MNTLLLVGLVWAVLDILLLGFCSSATKLRRLNDARNRDAQHRGP